MADDPEPEGDFEEESPYIRAEHAAYGPLNAALRQQRLGENEKVTLQLREKKEESRKLIKHREEIGVTLYGAQQQLAKLQLQLEQLHDKFAMVQSERAEDEEKLQQVTTQWKGKKDDVEDAWKRLQKSQDEMNQLNVTLRQVEEYNEQMKDEIQVSRRATYKHEDKIKQIEQIKQKQDLLVDKMNEDIKRMTEEKALLDAQLVAQKQETEAAVTTLREAAKEMEAIEFEKKQLQQQWRSSLHGIERRDEALKKVQDALRDQSEKELAVDNEMRGLNTSIRLEQERHDEICSFRDRNDKEMQYLHTQMTNIKQDREKLLDQFNILKKTMDGNIEETSKLKTSISNKTHELEVVERNIQNVSREITKLNMKMSEEVSEQTTCDRVAANSKKRMKKVADEISQKEVETQSLHNEIARVTVDSLNTKAHNQMLKDRQKQLADELAEREKLIEQYEHEIRKRHHQIEKKQLYVDRLNREYDEKRTKLEAEVGEADVAGPQEAKLKQMKKLKDDTIKECEQMQKDWIQKQTQLLAISTDTDRIKASLADQANRKMVLEQKKIRIENQLQNHKKEIKELEKTKEDLRKDMIRMNTAVAKSDAKAADVSNSNQMMETEFVQKLKEIENACLETEAAIERVKEDKNQMIEDILEAERQVLLWERKITLEKEMQEALDPNIGQSDAQAMRKEIHRMELRLDQLKRRQEQMILEMERTISKRDAIASKYEPKAKKSKEAQSSQNLKRQIQSLKNNLRLCTQANADAEKQISDWEAQLAQLQNQIDQNHEECTHLERAVETRKMDVKLNTVVKQRNLAYILKLQRAKMRYEELANGTGLQAPTRDMTGAYQEQVAQKNKVINVVRVLHDACPHLEPLWNEFYTWLEVPGE